MRPRLALVPGEPAGIGPELVVRALQRDWDAELVVFGDAATLHRAAAALELALPPRLDVVDIPHPVEAEFGAPQPANASSVVEELSRAAQACLDGTLHGLITGPVHKAAINDGGIAFTGTTGLLAAQAGADVVMMLANDIVRVALLTVHLPLRAVADAISPDALERTLRIVEGRRFEPGKRELTVGSGVVSQFRGVSVGNTLTFANQDWKVVGVFRSGDSHDSELWADADTLGATYQRNSYQSVTLRLEGKGALKYFIKSAWEVVLGYLKPKKS